MRQLLKHFYEFGPFRLDATERLLLRDGQHVPLTPKAFGTLLALVENGGHVIDKDELIKKVWPDTFVEEVNLAKNVSCLRKILGGAQSEQYIETIPKRGYRFVAGVKEVWEEDTPSFVSEQGSIPFSRPGKRERKNGARAKAEVNRKSSLGLGLMGSLNPTAPGTDSTPGLPIAKYWKWPLALLALSLVVILAVWAVVWRPAVKAPSNPLKIIPLTSFPGNEDQAAFSPDGNQVAFVWNGEQEDNSDIYVKLLGAETPLRAA